MDTSSPIEENECTNLWGGGIKAAVHDTYVHAYIYVIFLLACKCDRMFIVYICIPFTCVLLYRYWPCMIMCMCLHDGV